MENLIKYYPTGNELISIPTLRDDASIESINFLSMKHRGLIEICGDPFIKPVIMIEGQYKNLEELNWNRNNYWIPEFNTAAKNEDIEIKGTIFSPIGCRGMIYNMKIINNGNSCNISYGLEGNFNKAMHSINESKIIRGKKYVSYSNWNKGPIFELRDCFNLFSFGFAADTDLNRVVWGADSLSNKDIEADYKDNISYKLIKNQYLMHGETAEITFYLGIGQDEVSAAASAIDMRRKNIVNLLRNTEDWLKQRIKTTGDENIDNIYNLNLFFNYFYASGITLDTEEIVLVTSRSPRYYVSAAYWDRDSLLWSFPSIIFIDKEYSNEVLKYVFTKQIKNVGIHSRYIDGTVLEPGFELDELCAPIIALEYYTEYTKDKSILMKDYIITGIEKILKILETKKAENAELYETFLMPTDDMNIYPYLTYDNVLVWKVFNIVSKYYEYLNEFEKSKFYRNKIEKVYKSINEFCVVNYEGKNMYCWASDLNGKYSVYDEPPGSLTLLSHLGFADRNNEIFLNTCNFIYSEKYKHYFANRRFKELGCSHAQHPWILAVANSLLNGREDKAKEILKNIEMDNGIACESIDEDSGKCTTGAHFATCAGYLAYAINKAFI